MANSFLANQGTQTNLLTDNTGGISGTLIPVMKISTDGQGTFTTGNIWSGNVGVTTGTIASDTIVGGTLGSVLGVGGTTSVSIIGGTVSVNELSGTINVGTAVLNGGTIGTLGLGTVVSTGTVNVGTINAGTINTGTINTGTFVMTTGTLGVGTINLGTFVGKDANAAAQVGNPIGVGGTDSGGTIRTMLVDATGVQRSSGSVVMTVGTITVLPNLPQGSITVTAGTIASVGTIGTLGLGTITGNLGTIGTLGLGTVVSTGTVNVGTINAGTINTGTINLGTFVGKDANAAAQTGNPVSIGGTDSGGTVRTVLVNSAGAMSVSGASSGTFNNISTGTMQTLGTVGTIQNILAGTISGLQNGTITAGSIIVTNGTVIGNGGSMIAYGPAAAAAAATGNPLNIGGTDSGGTIRTIKVDSGGLQRIGIDSGTISVLPNLPQGSINVTAGTIASVGTIGTLGLGTVVSTGTVNVGTINTGTFVMTSGTFNVGTATTNQASGTLNVGTINTGTVVVTTGTFSPLPSIAVTTYGTHSTTGVSVFGTLAGGTGSGAGTEIFITSLSMTIPSTGGSQDCSLGWGTNGGTFQAGTGLLVRGNFPAGGGIQKQFYPPVNSGTNGQLCLFQAGAGTVDVSVSYFITPSTI